MSLGTGRSGPSIWISGALGVALAMAAAAGLLHLWRCGHFSPCHSFSADLGAGRSLSIRYRPAPPPAGQLGIRLVLNSPTAGTCDLAFARRGALPPSVEFRRAAGGRVWIVARDPRSGPVVECAVNLRTAEFLYPECAEGLPEWAGTDEGELLARWAVLGSGRPPVYLNWDRRARGTLLQEKARVRNERHALVLRSGDGRYRDARVVPTARGALLLGGEASGRSVPCAELDSCRRVLVDADGYEWRFGPGEGDAIARSTRPVAR